MRTTLDLPDPVFRQLKAESALRGMKMMDLVAELIQAGLQRSSVSSPQRPRSPLPLIRRATDSVHPGRSNRDLEAILVSEDAHDRD